MPSDPRAVQSVFLKAAELPAADRPTLLDRACAGDAELRRRVESLLAVHDRSGSFLDRPLVSLPPTYVQEFADANPEPLAGKRVGPYELVEKLGEGGMGSVWAAAQDRPIRRRVALKLIKPGLDSAQVVRRFAAERQALARMDHANIARILDAGVAEDSGRPYFAMELVKGVPITTYCDELNLSVRERLALFVPVCRAVQHAHQKGVVHRDLKPSNVLVCLQDGRPVPKVIDFGVAKAVDGTLTDETAFTGVGVVLGTPHYMSPEQAELRALDVDTRCDVYSLGVILYELLTGTTPLDAATLRTAGFAETLRLIREDEAPRPSARVAASRPALTREVRGDLDWIAMKCLEKDRTRRYESAEALARDAERYLADEPVEAGPPSAGYRVRKFVRRHRSAVAAAGLVAASLVIGLAGTTAGLVWALRERAAAERRLTQVENGTDLLAAIFDDLDPGAADRAGTSLNVVLGERLDRAAAQLAAGEVGDPLTVARLQQALGSSYFGLGYAEKAIDLLAAARRTREVQLGPRHPDTLRTLNSLVCAYLDAGRAREAVALGETVVRGRREVLGPAHPHTLTSVNNLVVAYQDAGRPADALPLAAEAHRVAAGALGPAHRDALVAQSNLASLYREAGRVSEAVARFEDILRLRRDALGPRHPETLRSVSLLAGAYRHADRPRDAVPLCEEVLRVRRETLGPRHPETLGAVGELAVTLRRAGRLAESIPLGEEALRLRSEVLGPEHPHTLLSMNAVAAAYREAGRPADALRLFQDVLRLTTAALGPRHPDTLRARCNVGAALRDVGRSAEAVPLLEEARRQMSDAFGPAHADTVRCTGHLIGAYRATGRNDLALPLVDEYRAAQDARATAVPPKQP